MAEEAKKIYKYREADMDRDSFIQNLNYNYKNYVESQSWTDDQKRAFREAYDAHMEALKKGKLESDIDGSLIVMHDDNDNRFGNSITNHYNKKGVSASDYDNLKKRKKRKFNDSFYANREVVSYFDIVADALYNKKYASSKTEKETEKSEPQKTKFNNRKNDVLGAFIYDYTGGTGELDYDNWLKQDMDKDGNFNNNPYEKRLTRFYNFLVGHINDNEFFENIDYSNTAFKNKEEYRKRLQALQQFIKGNNSDGYLVDLTNHDNKRQFYTLLNNLGVDVTAAHKMFTGKNEEKSVSTELSSSEGSNSDNSPSQSEQSDNPDTENKFNGVLSNDIKSFTQYGNSSIKAVKNCFNEDKPFNNGFFTGRDDKNKKTVNAFISYIVYNIDTLIASGNVSKSKKTDEDSNSIYYIKSSYNEEDDSVLAFTKNKWGYVSINKLGLTKNDMTQTEQEKSGGVLRARCFESGGNTADTNNLSGNNTIKASRENYNEWTIQDIARLGALAFDIGALIDPEPFSSTGLSFVGTGTDFITDLNDTNVSTGQALKSLGINAGLSVLSLIPVVGGAGKIGKIGKTLAKYTAKIGKWLLNTAGTGIMASSVVSAIKNTLDKIKETGIKSLDVDDFRNLYTVLTAIVSGRNAVKGAVKTHKINTLGTAEDVASANVLDVKLRNEVRDATQRKTISDPDLVKSIKKEYNNGEGSVQAINEALAKYGNYKSYTLASKNVKSAVRPGFDEDLLKKKLNAFSSNDTLSWWDKYNPFSAKTDWYRYVGKMYKTGGNIIMNKEAGGRLLNFIQGPLK